jgi:hypothetical protein
VRDGVARIGIGIGFALLLGALGHVITFVPGAEAIWFGLAAASAMAGALSRHWQVRCLALVLAVGLGGLAWAGYLRGPRYQDLFRTGLTPLASH